MFSKNHLLLTVLLLTMMYSKLEAFVLPHHHRTSSIDHHEEARRFHVDLGVHQNHPYHHQLTHLKASSNNNKNNDNSREADNNDRRFFFPVPGARRDSSATATDDTNIDNNPKAVTTLIKSKVAPTSVQFTAKKNSKNKSNQNKQVRPTSLLSPQVVEEEEKGSLLYLENPQTIFTLAAGAGVAAIVAISYSLGLSVSDYVDGAQLLVKDPSAFSQQLFSGVQELGPVGALYFALLYMIAEILAIPATPLTLSAGYLFGIQQGILAVLAGATGAACIGFWISRTFLRNYVESTLLAPSIGTDGTPNRMAKIDKAIGKDGFKLLVLIRLSPIFPFSLTNYLYGASSIDFGSYLLGTLIGFVPTTTAYVYTGMVGQALTGGADQQPWYVYAGGLAALSVFVKLVTDVTSGIIDAIDDDDEISM